VLNRDLLRTEALAALRAAGPLPRAGSYGRLGAIYDLLDSLLSDGVHLEAMRGPWRVDVAAPPRRRARNRVSVECGHARITVESEQRGRELAGFLNWCEVVEGDLIPAAVAASRSSRRSGGLLVGTTLGHD